MAQDTFKRGIKDNSKRRFHGGGPRPDHNEVLKREAKERDAAWRKLSPEQQLKALDDRLGKDVGACKQRARLRALIERKQSQSDASSATMIKSDKSFREFIKNKKHQQT